MGQRPVFRLHRLADGMADKGAFFFSSGLAGSFFGGIQELASTANMTTATRISRTSIAEEVRVRIEQHERVTPTAMMRLRWPVFQRRRWPEGAGGSPRHRPYPSTQFFPARAFPRFCFGRAMRRPDAVQPFEASLKKRRRGSNLSGLRVKSQFLTIFPGQVRLNGKWTRSGHFQN